MNIELAGVEPVLEGQAQDQLMRILQRWDLSPWLYTHRVVIQAGVIPHSHPVLTWTTRYLDDDVDALGGFLHEEIHWGIHQPGTASAVADGRLRERYLDLPETPPEGCGSQRSNYLHLAVNYLEFVSLAQLVGEDTARATLAARHYYKTIYRIVLDETKELANLFDQCGPMLLPAA